MLPRQRRQKAMRAAQLAGADALLVTHLPDVRWLTGFTGSHAAVAIAGGRAVLFTDGRYTVQVRAEATDIRVVIGKGSVVGLAVQWLLERGAHHCAFDARQTTVAGLETMRTAMRAALPEGARKAGSGLARRLKGAGSGNGRGATERDFFVATEGLVARLREVKDDEEIGLVRQAADLGCALFEHVVETIASGSTEMDVALELESAARRAGAEGMSFETIVASGPRSALPHGRATTAKLPRRGFVTLDFGVLLNGYCSDMTRTVHLGKASGQELDVYHSVLEAQEAAVAAVAPGVTCAAVDEAARSVLQRARLGKWFSHSTGHGVGLEIHEGPRLAATVEQVLEPGMVVTVEPGVYLPDRFGVRIEDMVLVTEDGNEVLTAASPKVWMEF